MHSFFIVTGVMLALASFGCIILLFQDVIAPKLFLRTHRITFDALDGTAHLNVVNFLRDHHVIGRYEETEDGIGVLTVQLFLWEEKKFLKDARKLDNYVEVL